MSEGETELHRPAAEAAPARKPPRRELGRGGAVLRGAGTLAAVALGAWLISLLGTFESPAPLVQGFRDEEGNRAWLIFEPRRARVARELRVVLSRLPGELGSAADRIVFPEALAGPARRLLPSAPLILIDREGRSRALDRPVPFVTVRRLQRHPPAGRETLRAWFRNPAVERELRLSGIDLRGFWE